MSLNPIVFTKQILDTFLRYQRTAFPFSDPRLAAQAKEMLGESLTSHLAKGPFVSLSRPFRLGATVASLVAEGTLHAGMKGVMPYPTLFQHQEEALRAVKAGKHLIVSTGTGSGKTEAFLSPILDSALTMRDEKAPQGVMAVLVYPMNALAIDQMDRLRRMLRGSGISYGMWVGSTPDKDAGADVERAPEALSGEPLSKWLEDPKAKTRRVPQEERISEEDIRTRPPRLLLTNPQQLEMLLTRAKDQGLFSSGMLRYLVFDEAHTYEGTTGAEVAVLIRRLKAFAGGQITCIGTSATLADPERGTEAAARFAHRFFGVPQDKVAVVEERYVEVEWPTPGALPALPTGDAMATLESLLATVTGEDWEELPKLNAEVKRWLGQSIPTKASAEEGLHYLLAANPMVQAIARTFAKPLGLAEGAEQVAKETGRAIDPIWNQVEVLAYLAMGVRAQKEGDPILRPKLHTFISGLDQAHARFEDDDQLKLYLTNKVDLIQQHPDWQPSGIFPVSVCTTCGQHLMATEIHGFGTEDGKVVGGQQEGHNAVWASGGQIPDGPATATCYFTDQLAWLPEDEGEDDTLPLTTRPELKGTVRGYLCRRCGSMHGRQAERCLAPKCGVELPLLKVEVSGEENTKCPACGSGSRGYKGAVRPFRPVRASQVADVHTLGQAMLTFAPTEHRKLLVFADSRQDAAFQAGWSEDHGRRHRLRQLMFQEIQKDDGLSFGALHSRLVDRLMGDSFLLRVIAPEVMSYLVGTTDKDRQRKELARYLRHRLMVEAATSYTSRYGLEPYGLVQIDYPELDAHGAKLRELAGILTWDPVEVRRFLALLLDSWRRNQILSDATGGADTFTRIWNQGAREVTKGYIQEFKRPKVIVLKKKKEGDDERRQQALVSKTGRTFALGLLAKLTPGRSPSDRIAFMEEAWAFLSQSSLMEHVTLKGSGLKATALPGGKGYSLVADSLSFKIADDRWRCQRCRKPTAHASPENRCPRHNCDGLLKLESLDKDNFDVALLLQPDFEPLVPSEHSAQVPADVRARIEREFKRKDGDLNCLVATPTLEMGVDIGALDMVLMRNMPPGSSNYWQRAGRAGRRERMASIVTYCKRWHHDQYFFNNPLDLLRGEIEAPRFNLRNPVLVAKHLHAVVVGTLLRLEGPDSEAIKTIFPSFIGDYMFIYDADDERTRLRGKPPEVGEPLAELVVKHRDKLVVAVRAAFDQAWPVEDQETVRPEILDALLDGLGPDLQEVVARLYHRAKWASDRRAEWAKLEGEGKELEESERRLKQRFDAMIRAYRGKTQDTYTLSVLALEGFLPGYGMTQGGCRFEFHGADSKSASRDLSLGRGLAQGVREFVPGNLIYAMGERFKVVSYRLSPKPEDRTAERFEIGVDPDAPFLRLPGQAGKLGVAASTPPASVDAIPMSDGSLDHASRITDDESMRFALSVDLRASQLENVHNGGATYTAPTGLQLQLLRQQKLRLVNLGPANLSRQGEWGYPICTVCGAARSSMSSDAEKAAFVDTHVKSCGQVPVPRALFADVRVDGLRLRGQASMADAANLCEALLLGARDLLDMGERDLTWVGIAQDDGAWEALLYDPMPGGSGVLDEILDRWEQVLDGATERLQGCPEACATACYECLKNHSNAFHQPYLDRVKAQDLLAAWRGLTKQNTIEPATGDMPTKGQPHHSKEQVFLLALQEAGLVGDDGPELNANLDLGDGIVTSPDALYRTKKVAVYLDGMSAGLHGDPKMRERDAMINRILKMEGYHVHRIPWSALSDPTGKKQHMEAIGHSLHG
ncbi:MAG: DEAD/DEAH box helicase [Geothrix sp.]|uniref:DEAD/DEAH box helicase n=1 Tax=Geothrix sp. TaxID=1962974 RepID=UPI003BAEFF9C